MLVRDPYSGYLHEVPEAYGQPLAQAPFEEAPDLSEYEVGQTVYDGLGNPVGIFPFIPLIAKALPAIAQTVLPAISKILPKAAASVVSSLAPSRPPAVMAPPPPANFAPPPMTPGPIARPPGAGPAPFVAPGPPGPVFMGRRPYRRRRTYGR
jgi:hypothetical protein